MRYDRPVVQGEAPTLGAGPLHRFATLTAAAGLALAALQSAGRLGLPWAALLVPLGLGAALVGAMGDGGPPLRVRVAWSVLAAGLVTLHLRPALLPIHWGLERGPRSAGAGSW